MLLIPAWMWWGGPVYRGACAGVLTGAALAALTFAESGIALGAAVVMVVTGTFNGIVVARRMGRAWPAAGELGRDERVAVSSAVRRGRHIKQPRLAPAAAQYVGALRDARARARRWRWLVWLAGAAVVVLAVVDSLFAPPRAVAASWLFVALFAVELLWWPRAQDRLLRNAERAEKGLFTT